MCVSGSGLSADVILSHLGQTEDIGITVLAETGSTNYWALRCCRQGRALPFACFAESQTNGRGRRGKQWLQAAGANVAMTLAFPFYFERAEVNRLPLSIALSVVRVLEKLGVSGSRIKWPNDIMVNDKKIAGILIETTASVKVQADSEAVENTPDNADFDDIGSAGKAWAAVIGIGFNYDMSSMCRHEQLAEVALTDMVSVMMLAKKPVSTIPDRNRVAALILDGCLDVCRQYPENVERLRREFDEKYDYCKGRQLDILLDNGEVLSGTSRGLGQHDELLVCIDGESEVRSFNSAEISVRPVV